MAKKAAPKKTSSTKTAAKSAAGKATKAATPKARKAPAAKARKAVKAESYPAALKRKVAKVMNDGMNEASKVYKAGVDVLPKWIKGQG